MSDNASDALKQVQLAADIARISLQLNTQVIGLAESNAIARVTLERMGFRRVGSQWSTFPPLLNALALLSSQEVNILDRMRETLSNDEYDEWAAAFDRLEEFVLSMPTIVETQHIEVRGMTAGDFDEATHRAIADLAARGAGLLGDDH